MREYLCQRYRVVGRVVVPLLFAGLIAPDILQWVTWILAKHNGRILYGTDTPAVPTYANPPGLNGWLEMHRLIETGLTPAQIFRAATFSNAEALGLAQDVGTVQVGKRANLLLLPQDPTKTIEAYDGMRRHFSDVTSHALWR